MTNIKSSVETAVRHRYAFEARDRHGNLLWEETVHNLTVDVGLNDILDKYWKGSGYTAAHFVGLTGHSPTVAPADTMASHAGWTEVTAYAEANRPALTLGAVSNKSVDNSASKATFSINADNTQVGGAFVVTNSTKGGTAGTLIGCAPLSTNRTMGSGDTLSVTVTASAASA